MPAWMTSELRELVCVPNVSSASSTTTSRPVMASARATARPTTPAPITTASSLSTRELPLKKQGEAAAYCCHSGHRSRGAIERGAQQRADQRGRGKAACAHERGYGAGRAGKWRQRDRGRVGEHERRAIKEYGEWQ